jgi:hypothetical protein
MVKKNVKWIYSAAKIKLREDIIRGLVDAQMAPKDVYRMREEYSEFKYENFRTNLKSLRDAVATSIVRMQNDSLFFGHDKSVMMYEVQNEARSILWIESLAPLLLKQDINKGLHNRLTPSELYASRIEYQAFPLQVFRNHTYQEVDTRSKRAHRYAKKNVDHNLGYKESKLSFFCNCGGTESGVRTTGAASGNTGCRIPKEYSLL